MTKFFCNKVNNDNPHNLLAELYLIFVQFRVKEHINYAKWAVL